MSKRLSIWLLCMAAFILMASAVASVNYTNFTMTFTDLDEFQTVTSDTTSKNNPTRARLYIYSNTSSVKSVFRAGTTPTGSPVTGRYYDRTTDGRMMNYTVNLAQNTRVYLQGRPDSSISSCTITGAFGAG